MPGPPVELIPKAFFHSGVKAGSKVECRLAVKSPEGRDLIVREVTLDGRQIPFEIEPPDGSSQPGRGITFVVGAGDKAGIERHAIRLDLDGVGVKPIAIPVTLIIGQ